MTSAQLLVNLQDYIVELQTQNRALKAHIFNLQNKSDSLHSSFHDQSQKLRLHIEHCQNQIMKRENRQTGLMELVDQLQTSKQLLAKQRDMYIGELQTLRMTNHQQNQQIKKMTGMVTASKNTQQLPPKHNKCRSCQAFTKQHQTLIQEMQEKKQIIRQLQKDLICLQQFIN